MNNWQFHRALRSRGMNVTRLAAAIGSGRAHVTQVLNGTRTGSWETREKLEALLTPGELVLLGWKQSEAETNNTFHTEHSSMEQNNEGKEMTK